MPDPPVTPLTRINAAVADVLAADVDVAAWATGGIHILADPPDPEGGGIPDVAWPLIAVVGDRHGFEIQPSAEAVTEYTVAVWAMFEDDRDVLAAEEWDHTGVAWLVLRALYAAPKLIVPRYAPLAPVRKIVSAGTVSYNAVPRDRSPRLDEEEEPVRVTGRMLEVAITYEVTVERDNGLEASGW